MKRNDGRAGGTREGVERHLEILVLEPWMGGSHAQFLEGWRTHSRHEIAIESLAPRHWKWRMEASAWELGRRLEGKHPPDCLFASDYVDLTRLAAFLPRDWRPVPRVLYMHENQLTYPGRTGQPRDLSFGFQNVLSCAVADQVVFNSAFHRDSFVHAARELLRALPRPNPRTEFDAAIARSAVVPPGIAWDEIPLGAGGAPGSPLRLLFNHRWEHDKRPAAFLRAVHAARARGAAVELVLLGEGLEAPEAEVSVLLDALSDTVLHRGFAVREEYLRWLGSSDVVVSTAGHEFYGIAVLEAVAAGCTPLLPDRLAYPEVLPTETRAGAHAGALYGDEAELVSRLVALAASPDRLRDDARRAAWRARARGADRVKTAERLDAIVATCARESGRKPAPGNV